ncbi:MAG: prephenate/arogenate dehydrogenase family protein [Kiloniellales bacterium]|nr:prephenate/arogenate dehydrogenase family protein [Kiloniellales bacterium]
MTKAQGKREEGPLFQRVALLGIGLIGSSLARAFRERSLVGEIAVFTRSKETRAAAKRLGLGDEYFSSAGEAVKGADLVIICVPIGAYAKVGREIADYLAPGAIISDVGSVKQSVIRDLGPLLPPHVHFIPGHPIAGTEHSGPEAGFAELFEERWCILTPPEDTDEDAVARLIALWQAIGSEVEVMDAEHHDKVLGITSHLPHLIAYTIVGTAADLEESAQAEVIKFSAGGFRDFTRIAASDPVMWRDVFLNNKSAVLEMVQRFSEDLTALQRAIRWGDGAALEDWFTRTKVLRQGIVEAHQAGTFDPREPSSHGEDTKEAAEDDQSQLGRGKSVPT